MRQLCPPTTCTALAPVHDSHAATLSARDPVSGTRLVGTPGREKSAGEDRGATHLARNQERCSKSHQAVLNMPTSQTSRREPLLHLQRINSSNVNDQVQFDHLKLFNIESGNTGLLQVCGSCPMRPR